MNESTQLTLIHKILKYLYISDANILITIFKLKLKIIDKRLKLNYKYVETMV